MSTPTPPWRRVSLPPHVVNAAPLFGPRFSQALNDAAFSLGVDPAWVLAIFAYESGMDPLRENAHGFRGLWQRGPVDGKPYSQTEPGRQADDYVAWSADLKRRFRVPRFASREALYCLNLAPARLVGSDGARRTTVLYAAEFVQDSARANYGVTKEELIRCRSPKAYAANAQLDHGQRGWIMLQDLEAPLTKVAATYATRIQREIDALPAGPPAESNA